MAGWKTHNEEQLEHDSPTISYPRYLVSSDFGQAVMENWQSEYLQFVMFILATVWLVQRGSNESKQISDIGRESDEKQKIGSHAKDELTALGEGGRLADDRLLELARARDGRDLLRHVVRPVRDGLEKYNVEQRDHDESPSPGRATSRGPTSGRAPCRTGSPSSSPSARWPAYTIYLRQRGSPESKPVGAPHEETGSSG